MRAKELQKGTKKNYCLQKEVQLE